MKGRHPGLGIALILLMAACFATLDTSVKYLGGSMAVLVILWARYLFQAVVMAVWLAVDGVRRGAGLLAAFRAARPGFQALRGMLLLSTSCLSFYGLQYMPVAEFTAIALLTPVVVTVMAATVLKEHVSPLRWALVGLGLAGALLVIRPGTGVVGWAAVFPLALTVAYAAFQVLTSRYAALENPYTTHFYTGFVGAAAVSLALWWSPLEAGQQLARASWPQWSLLLLVGAMGTVGHLFLILALGMAPASTLMPFTYSALVFATLGGMWVFGHVPDATAFAGMAVIAVGGAACVWLNMREAQRSQVPVSPVAADTVGD
ncbi:MAG TPA: DMT family transporter [Burkholderiaceae bacterium]|nr:DMT family transporter [Burkholderiaceae bacterium]